MVSGGGGSHEQIFATARQGVQLTDSTNLRTAVKFNRREENQLLSGQDAGDDWEHGAVDFRTDSQLGKSDSLSATGHLYSMGDEVRVKAPGFTPPFEDFDSYSGFAKWKGAISGVKYHSELSADSQLDLIGSFVFQELESKLINFRNTVYELDATHRFSPHEKHDVIYGGSLRLFDNTADGSFAQDIDPRSRDMHRATVFLQDEIQLLNDFHLILGSKFEHNVSTGFEYMPNVRLIWNADDKTSIWGAVSRAVSPPALVYEDITLPVAVIPGEQLPTVVTLFGNRDVDAEELLAYELGFRSKLSETSSVELNLFYNRYDNLISHEPSVPFVGPINRTNLTGVIVPVLFANGYSADSLGGELTFEFKPYTWWRLIAAYSYIDLTAFQGSSADLAEGVLLGGSTSTHSALFRSSQDLPHDFRLDLTGRYLEGLQFGNIPGYGELDVALAWLPVPSVEVSVVGQNLINSAHPEFIQNLLGSPTVALERGVYGKITLRF